MSVSEEVLFAMDLADIAAVYFGLWEEPALIKMTDIGDIILCSQVNTLYQLPALLPC
jgi:hypothetical protein